MAMRKFLLLFSLPLAAQVAYHSNGLDQLGVVMTASGPNPAIVQIWNNSSRTIERYGLRIEADSPKGGRVYHNIGWTNPIPPGGKTTSPSNTPLLKGDITVSLDSILWSDFTCSGPNLGHGCEEGHATLDAQRDIHRAILTAKTDDAVIHALTDAAGAHTALPVMESDRTYRNFYDFEKARLAQSYIDKLREGKGSITDLRRHAEKVIHP
jgi:hypothetical protein